MRRGNLLNFFGCILISCSPDAAIDFEKADEEQEEIKKIDEDTVLFFDQGEAQKDAFFAEAELKEEAICPKEIVQGVEVFNSPWFSSFEEDEFFLPKDYEDLDYCSFDAIAFDNEGDLGQNFYFEWKIEDSSLVKVSNLPQEIGPGSYVKLKFLKDIFDGDGENEPSTSITVCAKNFCGPYPECEKCIPEVCRDPFIIIGVLNLEGTWIIEGANLPFPITISVKQYGRKFVAVDDRSIVVFDAEVIGKKVSWSFEDYYYKGEVSPDRVRIEGKAYKGDQELAPFLATKIP